jgi:hypothetical protein
MINGNIHRAQEFESTIHHVHPLSPDVFVMKTWISSAAYDMRLITSNGGETKICNNIVKI